MRSLLCKSYYRTHRSFHKWSTKTLRTREQNHVRCLSYDFVMSILSYTSWMEYILRIRIQKRGGHSISILPPLWSSWWQTVEPPTIQEQIDGVPPKRDVTLPWRTMTTTKFAYAIWTRSRWARSLTSDQQRGKELCKKKTTLPPNGNKNECILVFYAGAYYLIIFSPTSLPKKRWRHIGAVVRSGVD